MDIDQALSAVLESALNRYLSLDPDALSRFSVLEGKVIAVELTGINKIICLFVSADGFLVLSDFDGEADAIISGSPAALAKMALANNAKEELFQGAVSITGDTYLANQFNQCLMQVDIDWEDILAQKIGNIAAHKIGNIIRDTSQWFNQSAHSVFMDSGEYIQEEIRLSPSNAELRRFIRQVDELREATDRLNARIELLQKN
ncbi:hypothetical protein MNBD_GAMMA07-1484 [hydrothermal vent metagenome]|uniref:SCP2 domain-containing protein n=1 Tax=hydrothermal vent metagenome TaxID=652676 RepID=A0A3B0WZZ8_9ZZZZ